MGKNRNYRDYSKKFNEEKEPVVEETKEEVTEVEETEESKEELEFVYGKEEVDTKGLDKNTFEKELPIGIINCDRLRVRNSPDDSNNNNVLGIYTRGTKVTILEDLGKWLSIEVSKNSVKNRGFVMSEFIKR